MPLPPQPILTRWGTWLNAADYYCTNYSAIEEVVNGFNEGEASSIKTAKALFSSTTLTGELAYIKSNFNIISTTIKQLEETDIELCGALQLVTNVESELKAARGKVGECVTAKLQCVLGRNEGYSTLCKIGDILSGKLATFHEGEPEFNSNDLTYFKYAPITSCDVERSFLQYKSMLSENSRSFLFENFKIYVICYCNS